MEIIFESSERSDNINWVKKQITSMGISLIAFEGYTVKNNQVSVLLDRGLVKDVHNLEPNSIVSTLKENSSFDLTARVNFSNNLGCSYYFVCYSYANEYCIAILINDDGLESVLKFNNWTQFAEWTTEFRDLAMSSRYEESGLPKFDQELRKRGIPWPGNLDYLMVSSGIPFGLLEFQNTSKVSVKQHCNNTWFLPQGYRKGDVNRWRAIDIIRLHSRLPLFIIVWSSKENEVKLKLVKKIVYPEDVEEKKGLIYQNKEVITSERLEEILKRFIQ
jgi:hypothetical protein